MENIDHANIQFSSIFIVLMAGMMLGAFFDLYRVFRGKIIGKNGRRRKIVNFCGDLCFWGLALILITPVLFWGTWLELRFYVWLLILGGFGLYYWIFSPVFIPFFLHCWRMVTWIPKKIRLAVWRLRLFLKKISWRCFSRVTKSK